MLMVASSLGYAANSDPEDESSQFDMPTKVESNPPTEGFLAVTSAMVEAADRETDALLLVWAAMFDDALLRRRIRKAVSPRSAGLPNWVRNLDQITPVAALALRHELGHEETIFVEFSFSGQPVTMAVAVSRLGTPFLEDSYPTADTLADIRNFHVDDPQVVFEYIDLSLADARARIDAFFEHGDHMIPPTETETWPSTRLLLSWLLRLLPPGGALETPREWTDADFESLVTEFLASPWAEGLGKDAGMHAERLFDFQLTHGSGEPLRWGATAVGMIMGDLYLRKVLADNDFLLGMPTVLRALVQFANERSGTSEQFTAAALEAVEENLAQYRHRVTGGDETSESPSDGLAGLLGLPPDLELPDDLVDQLTQLGLRAGSTAGLGFDPFEIDAGSAELWQDELRLRAGGQENLDSLDDEPLPSEDFAPEGISEKVLPQVEALAADLARFADAHFRDPEMTTVALRILELTARTNPGAFRRGFAHPPAIAALCWIAGKNNRWFTAEVAQRTIQTMTFAAGATTQPTARAKSMLKNVPYSLEVQELDLGDPRLLISSARRDIVEIRDALTE